MKPRTALGVAVESEGPFAVVGHIWRSEGEVWKRYLVRRHTLSERSVLTDLQHSRGGPLCMVCLSSNVAITTEFVGESREWFTCHSCGLRWWIIP